MFERVLNTLPGWNSLIAFFSWFVLQGLLQELIEFNLQQGRKEVITLAQTLLIKLTAENIGANDHLNQILCDRIKLCLTTQAANMMSVSLAILINTWKLFLGTLREKCPKTELFLVRIYPYLDWIQEDTDQKKLRIWTHFTQWNLSGGWYFQMIVVTSFLSTFIEDALLSILSNIWRIFSIVRFYFELENSEDYYQKDQDLRSRKKFIQTSLLSDLPVIRNT